MATLTIGRVGLAAPLIEGPRDWQVDGSRHRLRGVLNPKTTLAAAQALRTELVDQVGKVVAVTYSADSTYDGIFRVIDAKVDALHSDAAILGTGLFRFDVQLEQVGTYSSAEFQGLLDNKTHSNDHGLTSGELNWWHAGPVDRVAYTLGLTGGSPGEITRDSADGTLNVAIGIPDSSPKWTVSPANFYKGACYVKVGGYVRTGINVPMSVTDFELGNGLVKVTPGLTASASNGQIEVSHYDGAWTTAKAYRILYATTTAIVKWSKFRIIKNTEEECVIELIDDANEAGGNKYTRHTLTLGLRRGGLIVYGYYVYDGGATTFTVERVSAEAATAVTPTGADSAMAIRATSNDADGNRYVLGTSDLAASDLTQGGIDIASTNEFDFFISSEIDGSTAQTQDQAGNQCLQYLAVSNEQVRPIPR